MTVAPVDDVPLAHDRQSDDVERDKAAGRKVIPTCPFVKTYIDRHPEYASLVRAG